MLGTANALIKVAQARAEKTVVADVDLIVRCWGAIRMRAREDDWTHVVVHRVMVVNMNAGGALYVGGATVQLGTATVR